jgi:hypothetical protein
LQQTHIQLGPESAENQKARDGAARHGDGAARHCHMLKVD